VGSNPTLTASYRLYANNGGNPESQPSLTGLDRCSSRGPRSLLYFTPLIQ